MVLKIRLKVLLGRVVLFCSWLLFWMSINLVMELVLLKIVSVLLLKLIDEFVIELLFVVINCEDRIGDNGVVLFIENELKKVVLLKLNVVVDVKMLFI